MNITIQNDDFEDLYVWVWDQYGSNPQAPILERRMLRRSGNIPVFVESDSNDRGNVTWSAVRVNDQNRTGQGSARPQVGDQVHVRTS